jgi:hypothetical protein
MNTGLISVNIFFKDSQRFCEHYSSRADIMNMAYATSEGLPS